MELGLPAYYVSIAKNRRRVTVEWSDCDQLVKERRGEPKHESSKNDSIEF